jgi:hypothetical protein
MIHDLQIVIADTLGGEVKPLYVGTDNGEANRIFAEADAQNEAVRLFPYPQAMRVRHPAEEVAQAKERARLAEERQADSAVALRKQLVLANANAKAAAAEAKKIASQLAATEKNK